MPRKFVTHGITCIVFFAFVNEAHRQLVDNLFLYKVGRRPEQEVDNMCH